VDRFRIGVRDSQPYDSVSEFGQPPYPPGAAPASTSSGHGTCGGSAGPVPSPREVCCMPWPSYETSARRDSPRSSRQRGACSSGSRSFCWERRSGAELCTTGRKLSPTVKAAR